MKKKQKTKRKLSLKEKMFENRHVAWMVFIPLISIIYNQTSLHPYIDIRLLVSAIFLLLYSGFMLWVSKGKNITIKSRTVQVFFGMGLLFSVWSMVGCLTAVNPKEGLFPIAQILITGMSLFYLYESLTDRKKVIGFVKVLTILIFFHAFVGIVQAANLGFLNVPGAGPPNGLMGNRNLLGGFLVMGICFPGYLMMATKDKWRWISFAIFCFTILGIILAQTRTTWVATILIIFLMPLVWSAVHGFKDIKKIAKPIGIGVVGLAIMIFIASTIKNENTLGISQRLSSIMTKDISSFGGRSLQFRSFFWKKSIDMAKDRPLTGVGQGNWKLMIPAYNTHRWDVVDSGRKVLVKPHNIYVRVLSETGFVGFLFFMTLFGILIHSVFRHIRSDQSTEEKLLVAFLGIGLVGIMVDMIANFSMSRVEHNFLFAFLSASILAVSQNVHPKRKTFAVSKLGLFTIFILLSVYSVVIGKAKFDFGKSINLVMQANMSQNHASTLKFAEQGKSSLITLNDLGTPIEMYSAIAFRQQQKFEEGLEEIKKAIKYAPYNPSVWNTYGTLYLTQGKFQESLPYFEKALDLAPKDMAIIKNICKSYYFLKDYQKVFDLLNGRDLGNDGELITMYQDSVKYTQEGN